MRTSLATVALLALAAGTAGAQGALSTQGFGYPTGAMSAASLGTAGALAETDPMSIYNPAALGLLGRTTLILNYAPEYREISVGSLSDRSSVSRFPLVGAGVQITSRVALGVSAGTLLDRSWDVEYEREANLPSGPVTVTERFRSLGAINDVRLAAGVTVHRALRVGLGLHGITGENRITQSLVFSDAGSPFATRSRVSYGGLAVSGGIDWRPTTTLAVSVSGRKGGAMRSYFNDTLRTEADVPDRVGGQLTFSGLTGVVLAARADWTGWSAMEGLQEPEASRGGRPPLDVNDTFETAIGAEFEGPRLFGRVIPLRVGLRQRALPFGFTREVSGAPGTFETAEVDERAVAGGLAVPFAQGRAVVDLALQRARRSAFDVRESAWTIGASLTIRP